MASHSAPRISTFKAAAAQAAYTAVKGGADAEHVAICSAASDKSIGIAQSAPTAAEDQMEVAGPGGGGKALLGGSVSFGDLLVPTTDGSLVASTSNAARHIALAMSDGSSGDVIPVEVIPGII